MVRVNGEDLQVDNMTLIDFLTEHGYKKERIAVECNEEIVPKAQYESFILHSGDVLEVVSFVGGG